MALVSISETVVHGENFLGVSIDSPRPGSVSDVYSFGLQGWVLGEERVVELELDHSGGSPWRIPVDHERPDVASLHSDIPHAEDSGFYANVNALLLARDFVLRVIAVLEDGRRLPLGEIYGHRAPVRSSYEPHIQPLMITTLGRSGSTVLIRLLETHAKIFAFRPPEYDPRVATYWMDVMRALTSPDSYVRQLIPPPAVSATWWLGASESYPLDSIPDDIQSWMGRESVEALTTFCHSRIDAFYRQLATRAHRPHTRYFVEKYWSPITPALLWELYPDAREVILVRDFRDFICSTFDYNRKSGGRAFAEADTEERVSYVLGTVKPWAFAIMNHWKRRADRAYLLRYEDLIQRPEETLKDLLSYLDLEADAGVVDTMLERLFEQGPELQYHMTSESQSASIGRWRKDLSTELQTVCEEALAPALEAFGYADGVPAASPREAS